MKTSDNYCDYETNTQLIELGIPKITFPRLATYDNEGKFYFKDCISTDVAAYTWLEALEWLERQGFEFEIYSTFVRIFHFNTNYHKNVSRPSDNKILSSIQTAVKQGITILKEQSK